MYASPLLWTGALLALWGAFAVLPESSDGGALVTPIGLGIGGLALWIATTNLFANVSYTSAASYQAAILFGGYLVGRRTVAAPRLAFGAAVAFGFAVAAWALWQQLTGGESRAHGPFITPATLASTINLLLVPGLVLVALGVRRVPFLAVLTVLVGALVASQSRGGWISLLAAGVVAFAFIRRAGIGVTWNAAARVGAVLILGAGVVWMLRSFQPADDVAASQSVMATASFSSRLELYELAWTSIVPSSLLLGAGYHAFYYLLEAGRAAVPSYGSGTTYFVHNDYLQMLLELGVPGLAGLLFIAIFPLLAAWRSVPRLAASEQAKVIAIAAAASATAVHALVDFPFYTPVCVLIYAAALGLLDSTLNGAGENPRLPITAGAAIPIRLRRVLAAAVATLAAWTLAMPAAAEAASAYAQRQLRDGQAQSTAFWFEAARRLDARDWRYHWYVGQFWMAQAAGQVDRAAAERAEAALAASCAANPREVRGLLHRIVLHRRLRTLLAAPADAPTLRAWADHALELAPTDPGARAERERVWQQFALPRSSG